MAHKVPNSQQNTMTMASMMHGAIPTKSEKTNSMSALQALNSHPSGQPAGAYGGGASGSGFASNGGGQQLEGGLQAWPNPGSASITKHKADQIANNSGGSMMMAPSGLPMANSSAASTNSAPHQHSLQVTNAARSSTSPISNYGGPPQAGTHPP